MTKKFKKVNSADRFFQIVDFLLAWTAIMWVLLMLESEIYLP